MTLPRRPHTTPCTRCGTNPVPLPTSLDIDPLCFPCQQEMKIEAKACPGFNDSCGNLREGDADLCPDCTIARLDAHSPRR